MTTNQAPKQFTVTVPPVALYATEVILFVIILILAALLRLTNVAENPGWYTDETTHIDIANHRLVGETQYMLIKDSTLMFGRLPLFHILLATYFQLSAQPDHMLALRTFTGLLGVLAVAMLYMAVRRSGGAVLGLLAAFVLAIYPQAVLYNRFGFSYNLLPPLILLAVLALDRYLANGRLIWLGVGALAIGTGLVAEVWMLALFVPFVIIAARCPIHLLWSVPLLFVPFAIYALVMLLSSSSAFLFDLGFTISRLIPTTSLNEQWITLFNNYQTFVGSGAWILAGIIGLFALQPARLRWIAVLFFITPIIFIGRTNALYNLSAYYMIPLLPFVALGIAALIRYGTSALFEAGRENLSALAGLRGAVVTGIVGIVVLFFVVSLLVASISSTVTSIQDGYTSDIDSFLIKPADAKQVAIFINGQVGPNDVIVASPVVGWQFGGHPEDFQMAVAATDHVATPHLPGNIPPERLAFNPDYRQARFVVIDNLWRNWGVIFIPGLSDMVNDVQTHWRKVYELDQFAVYERS
jgi:4-amino-4-deoxy-L-arabinose transferase-like glycosyltransferase